MTKPDVHGPIDVIVIEFPSGAEGADTATALGDLDRQRRRCGCTT